MTIDTVTITVELTGNARDQACFERYLADEGLDFEITMRMLESRGAEQLLGEAVFAISCAGAYDVLKAGVMRAVAKLRERSPHATAVVGRDDLLPHRADRDR